MNQKLSGKPRQKLVMVHEQRQAVVSGFLCGARRHTTSWQPLAASRWSDLSSPNWRCGCGCWFVSLCSSIAEPAPWIQEPGTSVMCHAGFCQSKLSVVGPSSEHFWHSLGGVWLILCLQQISACKECPWAEGIATGLLSQMKMNGIKRTSWGSPVLEEAVPYPVDSTVGKGSFSQLSQPCFFFRAV